MPCAFATDTARAAIIAARVVSYGVKHMGGGLAFAAHGSISSMRF
jgi:hypothetical protein